MHRRCDSWIVLGLITLTQILSSYIKKYDRWTHSHQFRYGRSNLCTYSTFYLVKLIKFGSLQSYFYNWVSQVSFLDLMLIHHCCLWIPLWMWSFLYKFIGVHPSVIPCFVSSSHLPVWQAGIENHFRYSHIIASTWKQPVERTGSPNEINWHWRAAFYLENNLLYVTVWFQFIFGFVSWQKFIFCYFLLLSFRSKAETKLSTLWR